MSNADAERNAVLTVAAIGGLVWSLLFVIILGLACRLYANRRRINRNQQLSSQQGPCPALSASLSRLGQHLLQRELPPSYYVALSDPPALSMPHPLPPPPPLEAIVPPLPLFAHDQIPPGHNRPLQYDTGHGRGSNNEQRGRNNSDEREENEEERKHMTTPNPILHSSYLIPHTSTQHSTRVLAECDDVPLLSAIGDDVEEREDDSLLKASLTSEVFGDVSGMEDAAFIFSDDAVGLEPLESEEPDLQFGGEEKVSNYCSISIPTTSLASVEDSVDANRMFKPKSSGGREEEEEGGGGEGRRRGGEYGEVPTSLIYDTEAGDDLLRGDKSLHQTVSSPGTVSLLGDMMTEGKQAILALSVVERHPDDVRQVDDMELI